MRVCLLSLSSTTMSTDRPSPILEGSLWPMEGIEGEELQELTDLDNTAYRPHPASVG